MKIFLSVSLATLLTSNAYSQLKAEFMQDAERTSDGASMNSSRARAVGTGYLLRANNAPSCEQKTFSLASPTANMNMFVTNIMNINGHTKDEVCAPNAKLDSFLGFGAERYSVSRCQRAIECKKLWDDPSSEEEINKLLSVIVAKDYGANSLRQNLDAMEDLEKIKRFSFSKFNLYVHDCFNRFRMDAKNKNCNTEMLTDIFEKHQEKCLGGNACFRNESSEVTENYAAYKELKKSDERSRFTKIEGFLNNRVNVAVKDIMKEDNKMIQRLKELVSDESFKKLKAEQKMEFFFDKIGFNNLEKLNDPILGKDFGSMTSRDLISKSGKYKELMAIVDDKTLTAESFEQRYNDFRKKRANEMLTKGNSCRETKSLDDICVDVTGLADRKSVAKEAINADRLSSRIVNRDEDYERLKVLYGKGGDDNTLAIFIEAKRCSAFGLGNEMLSFTNGSGTELMTEGKSGISRLRENSGKDDTKDGSDRNSIMDYVGDLHTVSGSSKGVVSSGAISSKVVEDGEITEVPMDTSATSSFAGQFNNAISTPASGTSYNSNSFADYNSSSFGSSYVDTSSNGSSNGKKDDNSSSSDSSGGSLAVNDKVSDLMKRLAAAEERVDKMKADSEAAEADRAKQKKIDEENALIKELRGQITDLKGQAAKKEVVAEAPAKVQQESKSQSFSGALNGSGSISSSRSDASAGKSSAAAESYEGPRNSGSAPQSSSGGSVSRGIASVSGAILTSSSANDGVKTTTLASGLVLTTIDGLTSEKATQTISNRIIELNGAPFYIEEGGLVKEIIPVMKDGKVLLDDKGNPIYEKITKGKVGDKKYAKKGKDREPASITDSADLKRDQEEKLKRERAEYLKLKNITSGAINKK